MLLWLILLTSLTFASTEIGKVVKLEGSSDSFLLRSSGKELLSESTLLAEGDELHTQGSLVVIHIYPGTQISLSKDTQIKLSQSYVDEVSESMQKAFSLIDFVKGLIRVQVTREPDQQIEHKILAKGAAIGVRGTEFEVTDQEEGIDLDVLEGEVEVTSSGAGAERIRANEGLRFLPNQRKFMRRKFAARFKNHPGFMSRQAMRENWGKVRTRRLEHMRRKKMQNSSDHPNFQDRKFQERRQRFQEKRQQRKK